MADKEKRKLPTICFVALNSYNMFAKRNDLHHIGGSEVQQWLISKWLVNRGYQVSFITLDHEQPDGEIIRGVRIFKAYKKENGVFLLRFLYPRWTGLNNALSRANADIYYQRCACLETGQVALWCKTHKRKFVYAVASDHDCRRKLPHLMSMRERKLYSIGLRLATLRLAQTRTQQSLLKEQFGLKSEIFRNICPSLRDESTHQIEYARQERKAVLWVGRISPRKRFEWLLDIAQKCPEYAFDVVGTANSKSRYALALTKRAEGIPNVHLHGFVSYDKMPEFYKCCKVLCCTSPSEGFPNTFLEAWRVGIPVVSTYEVDGIIAAEGLGWIEHSVEEVVNKLKEILESDKSWQKSSEAARQYYRKNHTVEGNMAEFERIVLSLGKGSS